MDIENDINLILTPVDGTRASNRLRSFLGLLWCHSSKIIYVSIE
jgi:hypothetical protein